MNRMKIEWAPVKKVPSRRRFQILAAALYIHLGLALPLIVLSIIACFMFYMSDIGRILLILYFTYIYYDHTRNCSSINGNGWLRLRDNWFTSQLRDYFPIELVKTAELKTDRNYLLASFPHGVIGTGITINMGTNIANWLQLFPGIRPKIATLDMHFWVPFLREFLRLCGLVSCSKESLIYHLSKSNDCKHPDNRDGYTSTAVAVLVGGAQESLDARPRRYILTLRNRQGFVRIAIRTGAAIVPTFSFGEVDIFEQVSNPPNSLLRRFQLFVKEKTGVSPVLFMGRGLFQYNYGLIPQRRPIVQVVGSPIEVKQSFDPDKEYVNQIHRQVMDALIDMFETYKHRYIRNANDIHLVIN